jgi:putative transcriptional regulator
LFVQHKLKDLRRTHKTSALTLANIIGLKTAAAYYKKENGTIEFSLNEASAISLYYEKPIEEIFLTSKFPKSKFHVVHNLETKDESK